MTSYVNSYVEKTNLLRALLGDVRNQPIKRLMADVIYICIIPNRREESGGFWSFFKQTLLQISWGTYKFSVTDPSILGWHQHEGGGVHQRNQRPNGTSKITVIWDVQTVDTNGWSIQVQVRYQYYPEPFNLWVGQNSNPYHPLPRFQAPK